jgi:hypothetical protein
LFFFFSWKKIREHAHPASGWHTTAGTRPAIRRKRFLFLLFKKVVFVKSNARRVRQDVHPIPWHAVRERARREKEKKRRSTTSDRIPEWQVILIYLSLTLAAPADMSVYCSCCCVTLSSSRLTSRGICQAKIRTVAGRMWLSGRPSAAWKQSRGIKRQNIYTFCWHDDGDQKAIGRKRDASDTDWRKSESQRSHNRNTCPGEPLHITGCYEHNLCMILTWDRVFFVFSPSSASASFPLRPDTCAHLPAPAASGCITKWGNRFIITITTLIPLPAVADYLLHRDHHESWKAECRKKWAPFDRSKSFRDASGKSWRNECDTRKASAITLGRAAHALMSWTWVTFADWKGGPFETRAGKDFLRVFSAIFCQFSLPLFVIDNGHGSSRKQAAIHSLPSHRLLILLLHSLTFMTVCIVWEWANAGNWGYECKLLLCCVSTPSSPLMLLQFKLQSKDLEGRASSFTSPMRTIIFKMPSF